MVACQLLPSFPITITRAPAFNSSGSKGFVLSSVLSADTWVSEVKSVSVNDFMFSSGLQCWI